VACLAAAGFDRGYRTCVAGEMGCRGEAVDAAHLALDHDAQDIGYPDSVLSSCIFLVRAIRSLTRSSGMVIWPWM
jgi:hypothetical protein